MKRVARLQVFLNEGVDSIHGLLFDIDGTLVRGGSALPGSKELIEYLDAHGIPYLLVTNDANHSHDEKAASLEAAGLNIGPERILSAGDVIAAIVRKRGWRARRFFVMGDLGRPDYAVEAGLDVTRELRELDTCSGVIVGEENYDWQPTFNAVVNFFIEHPTAQFIVPNPDVYWPDNRGAIAIGAGGKARFIVSVLEDYGVTVTPEYLGKPYAAVFQFARSRLAAARGNDTPAADRIIMVGDSLKGDILGANRAGFLSILVLTGITTEGQLETLPEKSELLPSILAGQL